MMAVRRLNPAGTNSAPAIFWDVEGSLKTTTIDDSDVKQQVSIVESGVNYSAKRFNDLKVLNDRLSYQLKSKLDELDDQKKAFEQLDAMKRSSTDDGMRLERLSKEIEEVEEEIYLKTHYSRQLEHVLDRLKKNQLKFDAHMTGMEDTLRVLEKEAIDVRLLRKGLDAGLAKSHMVLEETQSRLANARKTREVMLAQRKQELKNAQMLQDWIFRREETKLQLALELRGDLTKEEESFLAAQLSEKKEKKHRLEKASEEGSKKLQAMDDAFNKLKQVTGVSSLEEMFEKFSSQKSNKKSLEQEVKDAEARLLSAKKAHAKQERVFQELKSSGGGAAELTRESINKLNHSIEETKNEFKITRAASERLSSVLLGLNQGSRGLVQRVQPYNHLSEGGVFELTQMEDDAPWAETLDALSNAEQILAKMLEILNGENGNGGASNSIFDDEESSMGESMDGHGNGFSIGDAPSHVNNIRIKSKKILREMEWTNGTHRDEDQSDPVTNANAGGMTTAMTTGGLGNTGPGVTTNPSNGLKEGFLTSPDGHLDGISSGVGTSDGNNVFSFKMDEVPSRITVKKSSVRTSIEAKKKEEMEIRRKMYVFV